ncbi:MAG TPA: LL-diaminopimelate aminotransferase [Paludibacteraceae bacterium]|nr:LL-diaminopimelate aminotransferase [Paludibacteraceae bacterium]
MALINEDYLKLPDNYLFSEITRKINVFKAIRPKAKVIHLDAGDTTSILKGEVIDTLHKAIDELADTGGVKNFNSEEHRKALITSILKSDYEPRGVKLTQEEIFLNDSSKDAAEDFSEILSTDNIIGILDPTYPTYIYSNVRNGRAGEKMEDGRWSNLIYIPCNMENKFVPQIPKEKLDVIYLNLPNNPTGITLNATELKKWVKYAIDNQALIIFDAANAHYIKEKDVPHSIYEIKGAKKVAIEIRSLSKTTGYTGTNFSFTIVPNEVMAYTLMGESVSIEKMWQRRHTSKYSGMPYTSILSAEAAYSPKGIKERQVLTDYYMENAHFIRETLIQLGYQVWGGVNSPYLWMKTPKGITSWKFFEEMLYEHNIVCTPGVGFCPGGEGYVRFTSFANREDMEEAMARLRSKTNQV